MNFNASASVVGQASSWPAAAVLIVLERVGKAIRNPPRDVMLSHAGKQAGGYGWAFGLHEALDQFGAMFGPLTVSAILAHNGHGPFVNDRDVDRQVQVPAGAGTAATLRGSALSPAEERWAVMPR